MSRNCVYFVFIYNCEDALFCLFRSPRRTVIVCCHRTAVHYVWGIRNRNSICSGEWDLPKINCTFGQDNNDILKLS